MARWARYSLSRPFIESFSLNIIKNEAPFSSLTNSQVLTNNWNLFNYTFKIFVLRWLPFFDIWTKIHTFDLVWKINYSFFAWYYCWFNRVRVPQCDLEFGTTYCIVVEFAMSDHGFQGILWIYFLIFSFIIFVGFSCLLLGWKFLSNII